MSTGSQRPWPSSSPMVRRVPSALLVIALLGVTIAATVHGREKPTVRVTGPSTETIRNYPNNPDLPITYEEAKKAGTLGDYDWGNHCDTTRRYNDTDQTLARLAIPSTYAPPCVPVWGGSKPWKSKGGTTFTDNGGATAPGVTATTIKVVFYVAAEQDVAKQLEQFGVSDSDKVTFEGIKSLIEMNNHLYETYGRRVEVVQFHATGDGRSPSAAMADAVKVSEMGAFASIGGPSQTTAYQHELARHRILCIACGMAATDDVLNVDAPYVWGYLATPDQILFGTFSYGTELLYNEKAKFAGSPELRAEKRRFGIVHYEQDPPIFGPLKAEAIAKYSKQGIKVDTIIQYILDPNSLNAQAQAIIGRLKRDGVTSVVFLGDPLMPRLLTEQATRQNYFPEWVFTGTAFTDTTSVARLYDQKQMRHAFGASSAAARAKPEASENWKLYQWWYGKEPTADRTMFFWAPVVQLLYLGVHMAGPDLNAGTFAGGMFRYPPTGKVHTAGLTGVDLYAKGYLDGDETPAISFGFHNGNTQADFVAIDDFTSIWWNADVSGPDEAGKEGKGMWEYTGNGLRISLQDPVIPEGVTEDFLFQTKLSGTNSPLAAMVKGTPLENLVIASPILQHTPKLNQLPPYKPWPDSPQAKDN